MTFQLGALWSGMSEGGKALNFMGVGDLYRVRLQIRIQCPVCGVDLTVRSMTEHHHCMHGTEPAIDWSRLAVSQMEHQPQVYDVGLYGQLSNALSPYPGPQDSPAHGISCACTLSTSSGGGRIRILEEHPNPLPKCKRCGSQVPEARLNIHH